MSGFLGVSGKARCVVVLVSGAIIAAAGIIGSSPVQADEGMWMVQELDAAPFAEWQQRGLELDAKAIYNPKGDDLCDAVVKLGGGTGSFVSPNGLIVTNHHVAFGALQRSSSVTSDYTQDGFLAETGADEIPALGYDAYVLLDTKDVTKDVLGAVKKKMMYKERHDAIDKESKELVKKAEKGKDVFAEVKETFDGARYILYTYFKIKDIRIVYAPPASIGIYGGEIDNWMWPRHTGDFSFLRAYVAPNGKSADYSEKNVPYHPKRYLAFSTAPLNENDFTMVIGYPGSTRRYRSSYSIDYYINTYYPNAIRMRGDLIAILQAEADRDRESAIKLASTIRSLENSYKNNQGMLEGLLKYDLLQSKLDEEAALREYMAANPDMQAMYGNVFDALAEQYEGYTIYGEQYVLMRLMTNVCTMLDAARDLYKWSAEQEKPDIEREANYMARDESMIQRSIELADLRYDAEAEKQALAYFIAVLATGPGAVPQAVQAIVGDLEGEAMEAAIMTAVDAMYAGTRVTDKDSRLQMFGMSEKDLLAKDDPLITFAADFETDRQAVTDQYDTFVGAVGVLRPQLMELRSAYHGGALYPDANRTIRLSAGQVQGYSPRDAVTYDYMTTLTGVVEKNTAEDPFDAPERLIELSMQKNYGPYMDPKKQDVPVCFLSTDDITGGNSGSPVLNGKGEIIGLVFDGNYEALSADYQIIPELTRAIHVDSRYILFIVDEFAGADKLLDELTIYPQLSHR